MEDQCPRNCNKEKRKLIELMDLLEKQQYHGSITIDFNRGVPQLSRIRKNEYYDVVRG